MIKHESIWKVFRVLLEAGFVYTAAEFWCEAFLRTVCLEAEPPEQLEELHAFLRHASQHLRTIRTHPDNAEYVAGAVTLASLPMKMARRLAMWLNMVAVNNELDPESAARLAKCRQEMIDLLGDQDSRVFDELMRQERMRLKDLIGATTETCPF